MNQHEQGNQHFQCGRWGKDVAIEVRPPYYLFGTQQTSLRFWSMPRLKEVGIERLTILGETDPIGFWRWEDLGLLGREIRLLAEHLADIDFDADVKAWFLSHLVHCYHLLIATTPKGAKPIFTIG